VVVGTRLQTAELTLCLPIGWHLIPAMNYHYGAASSAI
jgi:hypothetical protein